MRTEKDPNIWLLMCCFSIGIFGSANTTPAEEPVYFVDPNLKVAVEQALGITYPTPSAMLTLTTFNASKRGITDLTGLEYATNLTDLDLHDNQFSNISSLSGLTNLTELWLYHNYISDISAVAGLTNLQVLWLGYNQISDISAVAGITNLTKLALYSNRIIDISPLSDLTNLQNLFLEWNQISDISPLSGLTNLQYLRLYRNNINDISAVAELTKLTKLDLEWNKISDISTIAGLTNLTHLNLSSNQISDISTLSGLTKMTVLSVHNNQVRDISAIAGLTSLTHLGLYGNQISDISAVAGLKNLIWLGLDNNRISDISPLSAMTNFIQLDLRGNPLNQNARDIYIPLIVANNPGISLHYDKLTPTLTIFSTSGGSVSVPGEGEFAYEHGSSVPIAASANTGYDFVNWTGTAVDAGKVADPSAADTTVTVDADYTIQANFEVTPAIIYVNDVTGNDNNDGLTPNKAFATIQKGINEAEDRDIVTVYPGVYTEEINFWGKAITVQGVATAAGVPILQNPGDFSVSFYCGEEPDSVLKNFLIRNSFMAVFIAGSSPTITNVTIINNKYGIEAYAHSEPDIGNSILWNNTDSDVFGCEARYSCIEYGAEGQGNIAADPCFADPAHGDYHLLSERGRYWPEHDVWVLDKVTSPCIDSGDPNSDYSNEPTPNGGRINMGAYGGTAYASMSEATIGIEGDFNQDGIIDIEDLIALVEMWLQLVGWLE